jgi:hypothetical protein
MKTNNKENMQKAESIDLKQDKGIIEIDKHLSLSSHSYRLTEFSKTIKL